MDGCVSIVTSELVRCYIDAKNLSKAREVSVQLLQLCQSKKLSVVSNFLQYLVRLVGDEGNIGRISLSFRR